VNEQAIPRYPLAWPLGWRRTPGHERKRAMFSKHSTEPGGYRRKTSLSVGDGLCRLTGELRRLHASDIIISSNLRVRSDGLPHAQQSKELGDPGIAVYFKLRGKPLVLACDRWSSAADNMAAIAGHIEAVRASDRYGVGTVEQAFAGYKALPADSAADWRKVLFGEQLPSPVTKDAVDQAVRSMAKTRHPDIQGGSVEAMTQVNRAREFAYAEMGWGG
jgi:hypothetical protein